MRQMRETLRRRGAYFESPGILRKEFNFHNAMNNEMKVIIINQHLIVIIIGATQGNVLQKKKRIEYRSKKISLKPLQIYRGNKCINHHTIKYFKQLTSPVLFKIFIIALTPDVSACSVSPARINKQKTQSKYYINYITLVITYDMIIRYYIFRL